ncbi:unnamed protein product [Caenorhabditis angaria]|uniref:Uncharacterized protein n=1 Tax=Caenorhabditis angaria TaxID=860376 RepID=A0A9P1ID86_9PELO|nr:unnamed protein product [Caenorhabditis angaria]
MNEGNWRHQDSWKNENDGPIPPQDAELRESIERTAMACAKNGPQFESMMREKQRNNPKFAFMMKDGHYFDYYQFVLRQNIQNLHGSGPPPNLLPPSTSNFAPPRQTIPSLMDIDSPEISEIKTQIQELNQKISDSENNLKAHEDGLETILQSHFLATVRSAETEKIEKLLRVQNFDRHELSSLVEHMSNPKCSKDSISNTKKWIFENCTTDQLREIILTYLLNTVKSLESSEYMRLHILYLINDWAFHCQRKKEDNQMKMLARYVPKMYAYCWELSNSSDMREKLEGKLLGEWEGRGYFPVTVFKQLRNTGQIVQSDRDIELASYGSVKESIRTNLMATYAGYEQQHLSYSQHIRKQIEELQKKIEELKYGPSTSQINLPPAIASSRRSRFDQTPQERQTARNQWKQDSHEKPSIDGDDIDGTPFDETTLKPKKSYMALPAGIMVPLVPINEFGYKPIDPTKLEMPPQVPPSQSLLAAKDAFYKCLNLDSIVNIEGGSDDWDIQNYPTEFLDRKAALKKIHLAQLKAENVDYEDTILNKPTKVEEEIMEKEKREKWTKMIDSINQKVEEYYADQPIEEENYRNEKRQSRSPTRSRSRSSESRSSSSDSSGSSDNERRSSRRKQSRSRSRTPPRTKFNRSPSPETHVSFGSSSFRAPNAPLSYDNKGAQLMAKMGWSGRGLGANESGIVEPVEGGEVRDRTDQFKGLGKSNDAYEQFRKQRSGSYHERGSMFRKGF